MERNTDKDYTSGSMDLNTREAGRIIRLAASASIVGQMAACTKVNGKRTTCMVEEPTPGVMADSIRETMSMIRSMVTVLISGLMAARTQVAGKMASNMATESIAKTMVK